MMPDLNNLPESTMLRIENALIESYFLSFKGLNHGSKWVRALHRWKSCRKFQYEGRFIGQTHKMQRLM